jgi:hypothetical protein
MSPRRATSSEAVLSAENQIRIALQEIVTRGGQATIAEIYAALDTGRTAVEAA